MRKTIDVRGLSCPEPVLKLKQAIDGADEIELLADSQTSVDNCSNFARSNGYKVTVNGKGGQFTVTLKKDKKA